MEEKWYRFKDRPAATALGDRIEVSLSRQFLIKELHIMTDYLCTDDGGGGVPAYAEDAEMRTLDRIRLILPDDNQVDVSGRSLGHLNSHEIQTAFDYQRTAAALGAAHHVYSDYVIRFWDPLAKTPYARGDTLFPSWRYSSAELELTVNRTQANVMANAGAGAVAFNSCTAQVWGKVIELSAEERAAFEEGSLPIMRKLTEHYYEWTAALGTLTQFRNEDLMKNVDHVRFWGVVTEDGARLDTSLLTSKVRWDSDDVIRETNAWQQMLAGTNRMKYNPAAGLYLWDFDSDGNHAGLPHPITEEDFGLWLTTALAGTTGRLDLIQETIAPAKFSR